MKQKLFAFQGDVISSRRIKEGDEFQSILADLCQEINPQYTYGIYAPFKILKGFDEVGGALTNISNIFDIMSMISDGLQPHKMRCALVLDYVDTALESRDVSKMDGPAFHVAAQAILELKRRDLLFSFSVGDEILDKAIEGEINLMLLMRGEVTPRQRQIIKQYELVGNPQEAARRMGISKRAVSMAIRRSRWELLKGLEDDLNQLLLGYQERIRE